LNTGFPWTLLVVLVPAKLAATSFTLGSGNSGGIFSPSLYMGAALGGAFGHWSHVLFPAITANPGAYALVGMASVFAAAAHAPLTAFLIVFEMSGDYRMILPLMVTVGLSTLLSQRMRRYSIYTLKLFKRRIPLERDRDVDIMRSLTVGEVMTKSPDVVRAEMTLKELAEAFRKTHHHGYPVLDGNDALVGVVTVRDLENAPAGSSGQLLKVADIAGRDMLVAYTDDPLSKALSQMSGRHVGRMPVVDRDDPRKLLGLLRRSDNIHAYQYALHRKLEMQHRDECILLGRLTETSVLELLLSRGMPGAGRRVKELALPPSALITSVRRDDKIFIPHGETVLEPGDKVVVITQRDSADAIRQALLGEA
jgi:CIC family chloride channel protein